jgi:hypothetical protein
MNFDLKLPLLLDFFLLFLPELFSHPVFFFPSSVEDAVRSLIAAAKAGDQEKFMEQLGKGTQWFGDCTPAAAKRYMEGVAKLPETVRKEEKYLYVGFPQVILCAAPFCIPFSLHSCMEVFLFLRNNVSSPFNVNISSHPFLTRIRPLLRM